MQLANILINLLIYSDRGKSNKPRLRDLDYSRQFIGKMTCNSFDRKVSIPPASSLTIAETARTLTQDTTTQYEITLRSGVTYRWRFAGGTNPTLRTQRASAHDATTEFDITKTGDVVRYTWNGTGTDPNFASNGIVVGDIFHVEDGGNFNPLNEGTFTIVRVTDDYIEVLNSNGVAETGVLVGSDIDSVPALDIFSAAGVQIDDQARITATTFNIENRGIFTISAATSQYFEITNGNPGIPEGPIVIGDANGIVFFPNIYKLIYVESDQKVSIRLNDDITDNVEIEPFIKNDLNNVGFMLHRGPIYRIIVVNNGLSTANVKVALAE